MSLVSQQSSVGPSTVTRQVGSTSYVVSLEDSTLLLHARSSDGLRQPSLTTDLSSLSPCRWGHSRHLQAWAPFWRTKRGPRRIYSSSGRHSPSLKVLWGPLWLQGSPRPKALLRPPQGLPRVLQEQPLAHLLLDPSFVPRTLEPIPSCGACSLTQHRLGYPHPRPPSTTCSLQGPLLCFHHHIRAWGNPSWGRNSCTLRLPSLGLHSFPSGLHCQWPNERKKERAACFEKSGSETISLWK